jgi:Cu(I)/Ag(I) efflux system membrane protein CusA/SilA
MLVYLDQAWRALLDSGEPLTPEQLVRAVLRGAGLRMRPVLMTATATIVGLLPILFGSGTGSEVMSRLAAPMVGGMISSVLLTLLVLPVIYLLWRRRQLPALSGEAKG